MKAALNMQGSKHARLWMGIKAAIAMQLSADWGMIQKESELKQVAIYRYTCMISLAQELMIGRRTFGVQGYHVDNPVSTFDLDCCYIQNCPGYYKLVWCCRD